MPNFKKTSPQCWVNCAREVGGGAAAGCSKSSTFNNLNTDLIKIELLKQIIQNSNIFWVMNIPPSPFIPMP